MGLSPITNWIPPLRSSCRAGKKNIYGTSSLESGGTSYTFGSSGGKNQLGPILKVFRLQFGLHHWIPFIKTAKKRISNVKFGVQINKIRIWAIFGKDPHKPVQTGFLSLSLTKTALSEVKLARFDPGLFRSRGKLENCILEMFYTCIIPPPLFIREGHG